MLGLVLTMAIMFSPSMVQASAMDESTEAGASAESRMEQLAEMDALAAEG